jgi:hypothetical protein
MPLTKLDTTAALVLIDLQKELLVYQLCILGARLSAGLRNLRVFFANAACRLFLSTCREGRRDGPMP